MKKRIIAFVVTLTLVFSTAIIFGESLQDINNKINQKQNELQKGKSQEATLDGEISSIESRMSQNQDDIKKLAGEIAGLQVQLDTKTKELDEKKKEIEKGLDGLNARLRNMYKSGSIGFLDVILSSGNVSELLFNVELVKKIYEGDRDIVSILEKEYAAIEADQKELETLQSDLKAKQQVVAEKQNSLISDKETLAIKKNEVTAENSLTAKQIGELQADAAAIDSQIVDVVGGGNSGGNTGGNSGGNTGGNTGGGGGSSGGGGMVWPMKGQVTQDFGGMYSGWPHRGMDIGAPTGTVIVAAKSGTVIFSGWGGSYGNYVVINHGGGLTTLYAHCSSRLVSAGTSVVAGQAIARCGSTGNSSGPHLHFEVAINGVLQNPRNYL